MEILEEDLFNFVFDPSLLSVEKIEFIESNKKLYKYELEYFSSFKEPLDEKIEKKLEEKVLGKLQIIQQIKIIELFPQENTFNKQTDSLLLAAKSPITQKQSLTFYDKRKNYLIRLNKKVDCFELNVFEKYDNELKNFELVLLPENKVYQLESSFETLQIPSSIVADKILLHLKLFV
jgi:hypothetical protein